jgi:hypothetical protein
MADCKCWYGCKMKNAIQMVSVCLSICGKGAKGNKDTVTVLRPET